MKIRSSAFCSLSRSTHFQEWLRAQSPDLFINLKTHLRTSKSCRVNKEYMLFLLTQIRQRKQTRLLEKFLKEKYPFVLQESLAEKKKTTTEVFSSYYPHILTFPHKRILHSSSEKVLEHKIQWFIKDKIGVDFLVKGNYAYVEYFDKKYKEEYQKTNPEDRELYKYRVKNGIPHNQTKILKESKNKIE